MQALTAIALCAREYQDIAYSRVSKAQWLEYLNDSQRAVVIVRPDAGGSNEIVRLVPGTKQSLPARAIRLLDVERNMGIAGTTPGDAIQFADKDSQKLVKRSWHGAPPGTTIRDVFYDDKKNPLVYWVSPPVHDTQAVYIEIVAAMTPVDLADADNDPIALPDVYATAMQQWMLYRAYAMATQALNQFQRATFYFSSFFNLLGVKLRTDMFFTAEGRGSFPPGAQATP